MMRGMAILSKPRPPKPRVQVPVALATYIIRNGLPFEIGAINGQVVVRARQAGVAVPHTETLLGLLRLIEQRAAL